jgi:hypothetical protein
MDSEVHSVAHPFTNPVSSEHKSCLFFPDLLLHLLKWNRNVLLKGGSGIHCEHKLPVETYTERLQI